MVNVRGGHRWAKAIYCDKEWCPECGEKNSPIHQRRIARWFDKVMSFESLGMLTVTIPWEVREYFKYTPDPAWRKLPKEERKVLQDKERKRVQVLLSKYRLAVKRWLQKQGYTRGLSRWHWLGSCPDCKGEGCGTCNDTGAGWKWNPHLHIFIEEGYLKGNEFNRVVRGLGEFCAKWMKNNLFIELPQPVVVNFMYTADRDKKAHLLSYVTRPTLRHDVLHEERETTYKYRTTSTWGKFPPSKEPATDAGVMLEKGICPCCGEKVHYGKFEALKYFAYHPEEMVNLSCGYIKLPDVVRSLPPPTPHGFKLLQYVNN